ncbi:MAG TPA: CHRD domain-containing protein [Thermoanaerobaculia bacterium]|nr:CHRD domain-containing protein [Thermoanaerobaculia bacterium]
MAMRRLLPGLALLFALAASPVSGQIFVFDLRGDQEVPPAASAASGGCMGQLDVPAAQFSLICVHNVSGATILHIHRAPAGANGPVVFDLGDPASPVQATWTGMTPADIADLLAGSLYVNIHTDGRPAGEIRGQILERTVDSVPFTADGSQVVPPNASSATGNCLADLNDAATALLVQCTHDVPLPQAAHVHQAPAGENGPVVFSFGAATSPFSGGVPMTPLLVAQFAATFLYVDIHSESASEELPGDEIRGQIGVPPNPTVGTIRITKATFPSGGAGFGFTHDIPGFPGSFLLDDGQTEVFVDVAPGTYTVTEDDPSTSPGGFALTAVVCGDADSTGDPFARTATVRLDAGETVSCGFTNFGVSGADQIFVFDLRGSQEVPPVPSVATGGCMGQLDSEAGELSLICTHNVTNATIMHIHRAPPGENGPIAFDLGDPVSPVHATWTGMTPEDVADLLAGNTYVNIHTAGRPAGEIRGQILERTVDSVAFTLDGSQNVPPTDSPATGSCLADLNDSATELFVQCTHDVPLPETAHVHDAPAGENGPAVFTFGDPASPFSAGVPLSPRLVADFAATFLSVDLHVEPSEEAPGADIRGQIGDPPSLTVGTIRITKTTLPAGGTGFGFTHDIGSPGSFVLDDGETEVFTDVAPGTYTVTENDPGVAPGGFALTDVVCEDADSTGDPFARAATIRLDPGETVTCTFTNLRTSGADRIFVFHLSGDQEVPPVPSATTGGCMGQLDSAAGELSLICTHNVTDATIMHIHRAPPGENGPIAFDLGDPVSPVQALWTGLTPADIADLLAGNLYVNIHTGGRPGGEIRGQIRERTVDSFSFPADGPSTANGTCFADLDETATALFVRCSHGLTQPESAHLHDAPPGENGPIVFTFGTGSSPFSANISMSPRLVADFAAGFLYVDIHSAGAEGSSGGDLRGQLVEAAALSPVAVPTLSQWSLILLALSLLMAGWWHLRRRPGPLDGPGGPWHS